MMYGILFICIVYFVPLMDMIFEDPKSEKKPK